MGARSQYALCVATSRRRDDLSNTWHRERPHSRMRVLGTGFPAQQSCGCPESLLRASKSSLSAVRQRQKQFVSFNLSAAELSGQPGDIERAHGTICRAATLAALNSAGLTYAAAEAIAAIEARNHRIANLEIDFPTCARHLLAIEGLQNPSPSQGRDIYRPCFRGRAKEKDTEQQPACRTQFRKIHVETANGRRP